MEGSIKSTICRYPPRYVLLRMALLIGWFCLFPWTCAYCAHQSIGNAANPVVKTHAVPGPDGVQRPVAVVDAIRMTQLGSEAQLSSNRSIGNFSPDGMRFVILLRKGNLEQNTNDYSLVFRTADAFRSPAPVVLVSLASSSNRPAIREVTWLDDSDTILFLGEHPNERTQVYSVKCSSGELHRLTNHPTNLTTLVTKPTGEPIVYAAESSASNLVTSAALRDGFHVSGELLSDLIRGSIGGGEYDDHNLFIKNRAAERGIQANIAGEIKSPYVEISLSPDGHYFVVQTQAKRIPKAWSEYDDRFLQIKARESIPPGAPTWVYQYELVDARTGESRPLLNAPIPTWGSEIFWAPDSRSVVVSDAYLPLNVDNPTEQALRKTTAFLVEITLPELQFVKISDQDLRLLDWDSKTNTVLCEVGRLDSANGKMVPKAYFRKSSDSWSKVDAPKAPTTSRPDIVLHEDLNTPPQIVVVDPTTGNTSLLMDLNPQFRDLRFGKVEEVKWHSTLGNEVEGGLYWPPDYVEGKKYPLVIQTHGFTPTKFLIDGPFTTAFAAQALAGKGFFVLQDSDLDVHFEQTSEEIRRAVGTYEGAIDYLDRRGLIDRNRVGLIGFSRTCLYVTYALTQSTYKFAAAVIADGVAADYFQYMAFGNSLPMLDADAEALNGASPFADGLSLWIKRSSLFQIDKVEAPLLIQAIGPTSLLGQWAWFTGLYRLHRAVDMTYIPEGTHILEKPWERLTSQQGNVDWFCFWLKGEEDPDPAKSEQYARWRALRKLQSAQAGGQKAN